MKEGYEYTGYFNDEAYEALKWSCQEFKTGNRVKASKIKKAAERMEYLFRTKHGYPETGNSVRNMYCGTNARPASMAWLTPPIKKEE